MDNCIFCKIVNKEIPSNVVYEDEYTLAFWDISPQAKYHIVIIPKEHIIEGLDSVNEENSNMIGRMFFAAKKVSEELGILDSGVRIINNTGADAHQSVRHIHLHLLGGEDLGANIV